MSVTAGSAGVSRSRPTGRADPRAAVGHGAHRPPVTDFRCLTRGHTSDEMVIRLYAKFIPNLTRKDGSALAKVMKDQGLR